MQAKNFDQADQNNAVIFVDFANAAFPITDRSAAKTSIPKFHTKQTAKAFLG
jgi:hypothetical protein